MLKLSDVVNAFSKINEDVDVHFNITNGKCILIYTNERNPQSYYTELEKNMDLYLLLPDCHAIDSKAIMARFIDTVDNDLIKYELIKVLNSDRPCAKFMDALFHFGLRDAWSDYKYQEMIDLAIRFLNYHQLEYDDDISLAKGSYIIEVVKTVKKEFRIKANNREEALAELDNVLENDDLNSYTIIEVEKKIK